MRLKEILAPKQYNARVRFDFQRGHGIAFNESVLAGLQTVDEDSDIALEYPQLTGAILISNIERQAEGTAGRATEVLKSITDWADANNKLLVLTAAASKSELMGQKGLEDWYKRNGFEFVAATDKRMVRQPRASKIAAA